MATDGMMSMLLATGDMTGPVRPRQRELSRALEAADAGEHGAAVRIVLAALGVRA